MHKFCFCAGCKKQHLKNSCITNSGEVGTGQRQALPTCFTVKADFCPSLSCLDRNNTLSCSMWIQKRPRDIHVTPRQHAAITYLEGSITSTTIIREGRKTQSQPETGDQVWISYPQPHFSQNSDLLTLFTTPLITASQQHQ